MRKQHSAAWRCVTGLTAWMTLVGCGEAPQAPQASETAPLEAAAQSLADGPDFVVTSVTGPTSVLPGQPIPLTVRVCNQGTQPGSPLVELYLSSDKVITPHDPPGPVVDAPVGGLFVNLGPGECQTHQLQGWPGAVPEGAWYLGAAVDPGKEITESNEANNLRLGSRIGVGNKPDLVVSSVTGPSTLPLNQPFTATVSVCNQGTQVGGSVVELYLSQDTVITPPVPPNPPTDLPVGLLPFPPLEPGQCQTQQVQTWGAAPTEGTWYLGAAVDPLNGTPELIEDNNTRASSRIGVGNRPELVVTVVTGPTTSLPGRDITVTATVCNQGTQPGGAPVEWYLSQDAVITPNGPTAPSPDLFVGGTGVPMLNPGQCQSVTFNTYVGSLEGQYYVGAVVDPANGVQEFFEDNNTRAGNRIAFGSRPDFVVTSVSGTSGVQPNGPLSAAVRVCNQGTAPGATQVEVFLSQDATIALPVPPGGPGQDVLVGMAPVDPLEPGQCRTVTISGSTGPASEGTWYLGAIVDARQWETELFEDNNTRAGNRVAIGYRADFTVTAVTGPVSVVPGQPFNVTATVCNQGTQAEHGDVEVYLSQDNVITPRSPSGPGPDVAIGFAPIGMMAPGQCQTVTIPAFAFAPGGDGAYFLGAYADPMGRTTELFEDNNARAGARVGVGYRPDFTVTSVTGPTSTRPFQAFNATVTVCNQGTQPDYAGGVELYLSQDTVITPTGPSTPSPDINVGYASLGTLAPGMCQTLTIPVTSGISEGVWYLAAVVDPRNLVTEFLDDNNTRVGNRIGIGDRPDFVVTSVTGPASTQSGQPFNASARVCNQGTMSGSTDVALYLSEDSVITPSSPSGPGPDFLAGSMPTGNLEPGQCLTLTVNASSGGNLRGSLYLGAIADPYGWIGNELIEDNNTRVGSRITVN
ncbi:CARDB domain-containing protein [Pyxidicoccus trucidator]|uniref:CARDB domain-containing protein n=1 Tax=Pyxidicoccus trucidator TaxID=2709662 RepID=UPI0013DB8568|nr:CARDB domain-containing protein [Pyxidicoccus trucidator]